MSLEAATERGPHPVGVTTIELSSPRDPARLLPLDVWYPAREASTGSGPAQHPFGARHDAVQDAAPQRGPLPLVVFSHGNSGLRRQSTFLTTHLASRGFVVAAPDHTGNTLQDMLQIANEQERKRIHFEARRNRPSDMTATIERVTAGDDRWPAIDSTRIGALGHSYGGWTAFKLPRIDARVRAVCGLAPAAEPFVGRKAFEPGELPLADGRPVLVVAGIEDVLVDIGSSIAPLFERLTEPCSLVGIEATDHFHFCDRVPLLHQMHENNPRAMATRRTLPYTDTLEEKRIHRIVSGLVAHFFEQSLAGESARPHAFSQQALDALDVAARHLSVEAARALGS